MKFRSLLLAATACALILGSWAGLEALAQDQDPTRTRPAPPTVGETAPIHSLTFATLDGRPSSLDRSWGQGVGWMVVHVFDPGTMDLVPGTGEYSAADVEAAARRGGGLSQARAPDSWSLDDHVEQAHARFANKPRLRWVGFPTWGFSDSALEKERRAEKRGEALPEAEPISQGRQRILRLHLKRRHPFDLLLQAPNCHTLARLGVKDVPAVFVFDTGGTLLFSWQRMREGDRTNYLIKALYDLLKSGAVAQPRGGGGVLPD